MKHVLTIDGGGIRGLIPATILSRLEAATGPIAEKFDLMSGTSTGSIIVACLSVGIPAHEIVQMYLKNAEKIFSRSWRSRVFDYFGLLSPKYSSDGANSVLAAYLKDNTMADAKSLLLIPTLNTETGRPKFFKTPRDGQIKLSEAVRASTAAPTYFPPAGTLIDGGMFANDPSMCAVAEAYSHWKGEEIRLLSLGTGYDGRKRTVPTGGALNWITRIVDIFITGEMGYVSYEISRILGDGNYLRVQEALPPEVDVDMDSIRPSNLIRLMDFGDYLFNTNQERLLNFF